MLKAAITQAGKLSNAQQAIANYLLQHEAELPYLIEADIARETGVSIATVSRFWSAIGFANLKDVKKQLQTRAVVPPAEKMKDKLNRVKAKEHIASAMLGMEMNHLQETANHLSEESFNQAVELLAGAKHIYTVGTGAAKSLCELLCFRMNRFGKRMAVVSLGGNDKYEQLVHIRSGDVLVAFGFHGYPDELKTTIQAARDAGAACVLISDLMVSELHALVQTSLFAYRGEPKEFHSMVAPIAIIDALTVAVAQLDDGHALESLNRLYELRRKYT